MGDFFPNQITDRKMKTLEKKWGQIFILDFVQKLVSSLKKLAHYLIAWRIEHSAKVISQYQYKNPHSG
jgi:hypothetical protein